jgi:hypothetical protein
MKFLELRKECSEKHYAQMNPVQSCCRRELWILQLLPDLQSALFYELWLYSARGKQQIESLLWLLLLALFLLYLTCIWFQTWEQWERCRIQQRRQQQIGSLGFNIDVQCIFVQFKFSWFRGLRFLTTRHLDYNEWKYTFRRTILTVLYTFMEPEGTLSRYLILRQMNAVNTLTSHFI